MFLICSDNEAEGAMKYGPAFAAAVVAAMGVAGLSACGGDQLAEPARDHSGEAFASASPPEPVTQRASLGIPVSERAATREIAGRPMWADNRRYSAEENAAYQFDQHAAALGARDMDEFLRLTHRFLNSPPESALSLVRANGDKLIYDPASGLFGVVREDGAPRTLFKPADGDAYWASQLRQNSQTTASGARAGGNAG
jgi:pyocin large subunit-like protein